jgi:hypothetical protein
MTAKPGAPVAATARPKPAQIAMPLQASAVALAKIAAAQQAIVQGNAPFLADLRLMGAKP